MSTTITVEELVRNPAGLIDRIADSERVLVERDGRPFAEARPAMTLLTEPRPFGLRSDTFTVPADFDVPLPTNVFAAIDGR